MTKTELHRLKWLKVRQEVALVYLQSGLPTSLTGWLPEWKKEILDLEDKLSESGRYMKGCVDDYRIVRIPNA